MMNNPDKFEDEVFEDELNDVNEDDEVDMSRQVYDVESKTMSFAGRKATDCVTNTHIYLPKAAPIKKETTIQMKKDHIMEVAKEFNQMRRTGSTLTWEEKDGLKSLSRRTKDNEIVVVESDKSGKFSIMKQETYLEAGDEHVQGDKVLT